MTRSVPNILAKLIFLAAFAISLRAVHFMFFHFSYNDWDLAFFTQAHWNLLHGSQYTSLVGINYFGDHSYLFTFLLLPIFAVFPHPLTLLILKALAYAVSGYLLYRILRREVGEWQALFWMSLFIIFPPNVFALLYEFNIEAFASVFILLTVDFFRQKKLVPFIVSAICLSLIKENMLLIVFMFGLYALLTRRKNPCLWAWGPMAFSTVAFMVLVLWIIPFFRDLPQHAFWVRYDGLINDPGNFLVKEFSGILGYLSDLFGPYLIPAAIAPQNLFFVLPVLLQHAFSSAPAERSIYYHYGTTLAPFIFLAAAAGLKRSGEFLEPGKCRAATVILLVLAVGHLLFFLPRMKAFVIRHTEEFQQARWELINKIPRDAGVIATFDFLAPLSTREKLYAFHKIYADSYQDPVKLKTSELNQNAVFKLPDDVTYALIDMNDTFLVLTTKVNPEVISKRVETFLKDWEELETRGVIRLLRKKSAQ